jgi:hypothetical protein
MLFTVSQSFIFRFSSRNRPKGDSRRISHQPAVLFSQNESATSNQQYCSLGLSATSQQYCSLGLPDISHQPAVLFARLISHQPAVLFSQNESATSNQPQPASSTLLSEQTSTSHQPPANRTGWKQGNDGSGVDPPDSPPSAASLATERWELAGSTSGVGLATSID